MKRFKLFWTLLILFSIVVNFYATSVSAQSVSQVIYGDEWIEEGYSIFETHDSLLIFTGYTELQDTAGLTEENVYLVKTDRQGNHIWSNGYDIYSDERGYAVIENRNDTTFEYVIVGDVRITGPTKHSNAFIMRIDTAGNIININHYGNTRNEHARSVIAVDSGYVFVGYTNQASIPNDVYLVRTDLQGNHVWSKNIDINGGNDFGFDIIKSDTSFLITGNTLDSITGQSQVFLMNTDINGNVQWVTLYGDSIEDDYSYSLKETLDGGFILIGHTYGFDNTGDSHVFVVNTDAIGGEQWSGIYDFGNPDSTDFGRDILVNNDSTYYGIGYSWVRNTWGFNQTIFELDFTGNLNWVKSFGDTLEERGFSGLLTQNTVVGLGTTFSFGNNVPDAYFVRTTQNDSLECVNFVPTDTEQIVNDPEENAHFTEATRNEWERDSTFLYEIDIWSTVCLDSANRYANPNTQQIFNHEPINNFSLYPNPANSNLHVLIIADALINGRLEIIDLQGRIITSSIIYQNELTISVESLNSGIYFVRLKSNGALEYLEKLIITK